MFVPYFPKFSFLHRYCWCQEESPVNCNACVPFLSQSCIDFYQEIQHLQSCNGALEGEIGSLVGVLTNHLQSCCDPLALMSSVRMLPFSHRLAALLNWGSADTPSTGSVAPTSLITTPSCNSSNLAPLSSHPVNVSPVVSSHLFSGISVPAIGCTGFIATSSLSDDVLSHRQIDNDISEKADGFSWGDYCESVPSSSVVTSSHVRRKRRESVEVLRRQTLMGDGGRGGDYFVSPPFLSTAEISSDCMSNSDQQLSLEEVGCSDVPLHTFLSSSNRISQKRFNMSSCRHVSLTHSFPMTHIEPPSSSLDSQKSVSSCLLFSSSSQANSPERPHTLHLRMPRTIPKKDPALRSSAFARTEDDLSHTAHPVASIPISYAAEFLVNEPILRSPGVPPKKDPALRSPIVSTWDMLLSSPLLTNNSLPCDSDELTDTYIDCGVMETSHTTRTYLNLPQHAHMLRVASFHGVLCENNSTDQQSLPLNLSKRRKSEDFGANRHW